MAKIYIVPIEPIDTRYTREWYDHIPKLLDAAGADVVIIEGDDVPAQPTPGAFLDFGATNIYKSSQLMTLAQLFRDSKIQAGDKFLYTDAWNPTVIQLKYMSSLLNIPVEIHGMWHAGSYDPQDFLGRLVGDEPWVRDAERSMYACYDVNWFATKFHADLFATTLFGEEFDSRGKIRQTGWPMDYLFDILPGYAKTNKKPQIVFPHRLAPEKQLAIFEDLAASMPQYEWVICQKQPLTKEQYHTILGESAIVFSANLQETYGISAIEGLICGAAPMLPDRLSYTEMYLPDFKYPSEWTASFDTYVQHKAELMALIEHTMQRILTRDNQLLATMSAQVNELKRFTHASPLIASLASH